MRTLRLELVENISCSWKMGRNVWESIYGKRVKSIRINKVTLNKALMKHPDFVRAFMENIEYHIPTSKLPEQRYRDLIRETNDKVKSIVDGYLHSFRDDLEYSENNGVPCYDPITNHYKEDVEKMYNEIIDLLEEAQEKSLIITLEYFQSVNAKELIDRIHEDNEMAP